MVNKKILVSIFSILTTLAMMGGATYAYFSSEATSVNNTFATGTINLLLSDNAVNGGNGESDQASVASSFGAANMIPGACTSEQTLTVHNSGNINGGISLSGTNSNATLAPYLRIESLTYAGANVNTGIDSNSNVFADLADLQNSSPISAGVLNAGETKQIKLAVCLDESAPNSVQGVSNTFKLTVILDQEH